MALTDTSRAETVAAVDLGSNSFHMVIARLVEGELHIIDRIKESVRLAAGLDEQRRLTGKARSRAIDCLCRFSERLRGIPEERVRIVGTNTLRRARNAAEFRAEAESALGYPIEVISGQEEGRLVHLAVARDLGYPDLRLLVVDIGGGSTELIVGDGREIVSAHSLFIGCVSQTVKFFADGAIDKPLFRRAETAARLELQSIERPLRDHGWDRVFGTSGTINAIFEIVRATGWSADGISLSSLKKLRKSLFRAGSASAIDLPGLRKERRDVLAGGLSVLLPVFDALAIETMHAAPSALREGVLYDLVGRLLHDDARDRTIRRLVTQYRVDREQARRVEATALEVLAQVSGPWGIDREWAQRLLSWASSLHEMGLAVAYSGFHKHGAYLIANAFMPGFSADEQMLLAAIVRGHRRKITPVLFDALAPGTRDTAIRLCVLLRLAVLLNRGRGPSTVPPFAVQAEGSRIRLGFPEGWLAEHPLTQADLTKEASYLSPVGISLQAADAKKAGSVRPG